MTKEQKRICGLCKKENIRIDHSAYFVRTVEWDDKGKGIKPIRVYTCDGCIISKEGKFA